MSRLQELLEKQQKLEAQIAEETAREGAEKAIATLGGNLADYLTSEAGKAKVDIEVLHGKFFSLTVGDDGKLAVSLVAKANGNGHKATSFGKNGNGGTGNGHYEYFLKDGRGGFATVQEAMDAMGIDKAKRPAHNRYDRLSDDWKAKIERRVKVSQVAS
jgi:hypothetical protein